MSMEMAQADVEVDVEDDPSAAVAEGTTGEEVTVPIPSDPAAQVDTPAGGESLFPPFDFSAFPSHLFWLAIAFGILFFFVNRLVVPKVGGIIEDRRDRVASDLGEASRLARETDEVVAAYEAELAAARQKAFAIAQERREEIKAEQARQQAETEKALAERIAEAETRIAESRDAALAQVDAIAAEAAQAIVQQVGGIAVTEDEVNKAIRSREAVNA